MTPTPAATRRPGRRALTGAFLLLSTGLFAQQTYTGPSTNSTITWVTPDDNNGRVPFCRGYYTADRFEDNGSDWWTDYPGADINLLVRLREVTSIRTGRNVVVKLDSPLLSLCPVLFMEDVGTMLLSDAEVRGLRAYLSKGGFLWVDDFWGSEAWDQWVREIRRVLPDAPMETLGATHPVFNQQYRIPGIWQMPTIGWWVLQDDGTRITSERGDDSIQATARGMFDRKGRLVVLSTHNTDIADGWEEDKPENAEFLSEYSWRSYALGVNIFLYALSH